MKKTTSNLRRLSILVGLAMLLVASGVAQAITFTANVSDKWSDPRNWDPQQVPGPGDSAEVGRIVTLDIPVTVANLKFGGADVYLNGTANQSSSLTVTNRFDVTGGAIRGGGNLVITIPATATLALSGSPFIVDGVTINNAGRIEWSGGPVYFEAILNNSGLFVISADAGFGTACRCGIINNTGRIEKQTGSGKAQLSGFTAQTNSINTTLNNKGVVAVASGSLEIGSGTSNGEFIIAGGKTLSVVYSHTFDGARFTGPGTCSLMISSDFLGTIGLEGTLELAVESPGLRGGNGGTVKEATFEGPGRFVWKTNGYASYILGKVTLGANIRSELSGGGLKQPENLINQGTMNWLGGAPIGERGAFMRNEGTLNVLAAGTFLGYASNFENVGTVNTFGGGTNESQAAVFTNAGVLNIGGFGKAGILNSTLPGGFKQTASGTLAMEVGGTNAATPEFDQLIANGATVDGALNVDVINNFTPAKGARFTLINSQTGKFARVFTPGGPERMTIEYPGNAKTDLVSLSDLPIPLRLWGAGRDLARNESPDRGAEAQAVNESVPQWSYGYRSTAGGTNLTLFRPEQHINDGSGLQGWIAPGQITLAVNTRNSPIIFNTGSGDYKPLLADQIYMSPGPNHEFLVARWTAPAAGDYRITARWVDLDNHGGNGATAYLFKNGQETLCDDPNESDCHAYVETFESKGTKLGRARLRARTMSLNAGDVLDFVLGSNGDSSFDATAFNAAIRRIPKVTKLTVTPSAADNTYSEGQEIAIDVEVDHIAPIASVIIDDVLDVIGRSSQPPYHFTKILEPGVHYIRATALDDRSAPGVSRPLKITVKKGGTGTKTSVGARTAIGSGDKARAAAFTGTTYYCVNKHGYWQNPTTWSPQGVPSNDDMAVIGAGFEVLVNSSHVVHTLDLGGRISQVPGDAPEPGVYVNKTATITGGEIDGIPGHKPLIFRSAGKLNICVLPAIFKDVELQVYRKFNLVGGGVVSERSSFINTGDVHVAAEPGTQKQVTLDVGALKHNGGTLTGAGNTVVLAPLGATIAGPVNMTPGAAPAISENGAGLVGPDGNSLVGPDGNTLVGKDGGSLVSENGLGLITDNGAALVGPDGNSLIGNDGNRLFGPDGLPLVGNDGASLVGNDGNTAVPKRALHSAAAAPDGSTAAAAASPGEIVLAKGAVIYGTGELRGNVTNRDGFIAPGHSPGGIAVNGNYTQEAGGTLVLELGGNTFFEHLTYDLFQVAGNATLGGNLVVKTIDGYTPASGEMVPALLYGSHTGNFDSITSNTQLNFGATGATITTKGTNPQGPRALNISTRLQIQSGDNALFAGFIVTGPAGSTKKVLIRGIGPSLAKFGVPGTIPDPFLELHTSSATITNDNWQQAPNANEIPNGFAPSDPKESAIVATLAPGSYSAVLKGAHGETGVGLAEVYDLEPNSGAQLANIATRGFVQTGDSVLIGGFIVAGNQPAKVLVRAIGPSLSAFLPGALQDTVLEVHDANGGVISNDNWRETDEAAIQATTIPPSNDKESAVLAVLAPGSYTAIVRGAGDSTGIAVVEAYNLSQ